MAIDKQILWELLVHRLQAMKEKLSVEYEWLLWVVHRVLFHNPLYDIHIQGNSVSFIFKGDCNKLLHELTNFDLQNVEINEPSLEEIFLHYYI